MSHNFHIFFHACHIKIWVNKDIVVTNWCETKRKSIATTRNAENIRSLLKMMTEASSIGREARTRGYNEDAILIAFLYTSTISLLITVNHALDLQPRIIESYELAAVSFLQSIWRLWRLHYTLLFSSLLSADVYLILTLIRTWQSGGALASFFAF